MDKKSLRKTYLEKRKALSHQDIERFSEAIVRQFSVLPLTGITFIHVFYPITAKREVDSLKIAAWLRSQHPEIQLALSICNFEDHSLSHIRWQQNTALQTNSWGITEPVDGEKIKTENIDMVIVPLLAYDMNGNRVGYGKGFYDRLLTECRTDVLKVGVSFFGPEETLTDAGPHDIPLNMCIAPDRIWKF